MAADLFYVFPNECMNCGAPEAVAPDLMDHIIGEAGHEHCHFKRQPETPAEFEQAMRAVDASCCGAVVYLGDDAAMVKALGSDPPGATPYQWRDRVLPSSAKPKFGSATVAVWILYIAAVGMLLFFVLGGMFVQHVTEEKMWLGYGALYAAMALAASARRMQG